MKTFIKTLLAASVLVAAGAAQAATINISYSTSATAEADFIASLTGGITATETFEDEATNGNAEYFGGNDQSNWEDRAVSYSTDVGTFELVTAGQSIGNPNNHQLMIESARTGEFGRQAIEDNDDFWLDSNDAETVVWTLGAPLSGSFNAFGFWLADASDVSADLTLTFSDGSSSNWSLITYPQANGDLKYVTVTSSQNILGGTLTFSNTTDNDGWGIDNVTVGSLPEPGTLLLMGLGLLGLGAARRRTAK